MEWHKNKGARSGYIVKKGYQEVKEWAKISGEDKRVIYQGKIPVPDKRN